MCVRWHIKCWSKLPAFGNIEHGWIGFSQAPQLSIGHGHDPRQRHISREGNRVFLFFFNKTRNYRRKQKQCTYTAITSSSIHKSTDCTNVFSPSWLCTSNCFIVELQVKERPINSDTGVEGCVELRGSINVNSNLRKLT